MTFADWESNPARLSKLKKKLIIFGFEYVSITTSAHYIIKSIGNNVNKNCYTNVLSLEL